MEETIARKAMVPSMHPRRSGEVIEVEVVVSHSALCLQDCVREVAEASVRRVRRFRIDRESSDRCPVVWGVAHRSWAHSVLGA